MQSTVKFDTYVQQGTVLHNYAHIFDLLTSLRMAVDHPYLFVHRGSADSLHGTKFLEGPWRQGFVCGLCQEEIVDDAGDDGPRRTAKCGHNFHDECIRAYVADAPTLQSGGIGCPVCFAKLSVDLGDSGDSDEDEEQTARQ